MRTVATFECARFNLTEQKDYFVNEGCFGDDLGKWLISELRAAGASTDEEPGQEDFGWYVNYAHGGLHSCAVIGNVGGESWFVVIERATGLLGSLLGGRNRNVPEEGVELVHRILSSCPDVKNLLWHHWRDFRKGSIDAFSSGRATPEAP